MSKKTILWLTAAAALILTGSAIFVGVMSAMDWDFSKLSTSEKQTNHYEVSEDFQDISIRTNTADVLLVPSEDGKISVSCHEYARQKHTVSVVDNTLVIQYTDTRKWYDHIGINFGSAKITIAIPGGVYGDLSVRSHTGDVKLLEEYQFESIDISLTTGNVTCRATSLSDIKIKTTTGDILVDHVTAAGLSLVTSTGKVTANGVNCSVGDVSVRVSTGKTALTDLLCKNLTSEGDTGSITLKNVIASGRFSIERDTGNVKFENCDAEEIFVETDTGDVKGTLLSEKVFMAKSDTGKISVPKTVTGGRCEIETDTGDIKIQIP